MRTAGHRSFLAAVPSAVPAAVPAAVLAALLLAGAAPLHAQTAGGAGGGAAGSTAKPPADTPAPVAAPAAPAAPAVKPAGKPVDPDAPATAEAVAVATADLARGLKLADPSERAAVVALNAGVNDAKVVKALAKYLKDKAREVRLAAIEALGATRHAEALKELHRLCKAGDAEADEGELVAALKATGRHGDKSSLAVLGADAWEDHRVPVIQARVYAIAAVREAKSVALLMELLEKDPTVPWQTSPYTGHFRVALARLTGADRGSNRDGWRDWWREAKDKVKVSPDPPHVPPDVQGAWDEFWKTAPRPETPPPANGG